jgi:hypothetical protein
MTTQTGMAAKVTKQIKRLLQDHNRWIAASARELLDSWRSRAEVCESVP